MSFGKARCMLEARDGTIAHLITSRLGTCALITTCDDVNTVHLSRCTYAKLYSCTATLREAVAACEKQESE